MRKDLRINLKRILALTLSTAMILSTDYIVKADSDKAIFIEEVVEESINADDSVCEAVTESDETVSDEDSYAGEVVCEEVVNAEDVIIEENAGDSIIVERADEITSEEVIASECIVEECGLEEDGYASIEEAEVYASDVSENNSGLSAEDKKARNNDTMGDDEWASHVGLKLRKYLAKKYSSLDTNHDGELSGSEMKANVSFNTIEINGNDYPELSKNMVQFSILGNFNNVDTVIIDGVDEIRDLFLPDSAKRLIIRNTTLNLTKNSILGDSTLEGNRGFNYFNLEKLIFDNVTIGDRFETVDSDPEEINNANRHDSNSMYASIYKIDISNSVSLNELKADLKFVSPSSTLVFNGGNTKFENLSVSTCSIGKSSLYGRVGVLSKNPDSFFCKNNFSIVDDVEFNDAYFKKFLIERAGADINNDGFLTQDELSKVKNLTCNIDTIGSRYIVMIHDFTDIAKLSNLENLTIDLDKGRSDTYISDIAFPNNGTLNNITIKSTKTKFVSINAPSVEKFIYTDNCTYEGETDPYIVINDTQGKLRTLDIYNSNVKSVTLNNGSSNKKNLSINAHDCNSLESIEFTGSGYTLLGDNRFDNCTILKGIGSKTTESEKNTWTLDYKSNNSSSDSILNLANCTKMCKDENKLNLVIDVNAGNLTIMGYGFGGDSIPQGSFSISKSESGNIIVYCNSGSWLYNYVSDRFEARGGSSRPNIVTFSLGNHIRETQGSGETAYDQWVDQYDIVLRVGDSTFNGDSINNFTDSNNLKFYVAEAGSVREIKQAPDGISYEITNYPTVSGNECVEINDTNRALKALHTGKATIKEYITYTENGTSVKECVGMVNVYVRNIATNVVFTNNNEANENDGQTVEQPIYVAKDAKLSLSAEIKYDGNNLPTEHDEVYWLFKEPRDGTYKDIQVPFTTEAGINVYSDSWNGRVNTRVFTFRNKGKYKVEALAPVNKTGNASNGNLILQGRYIEVVDPATVSISNKTITQSSPATITLTNSKSDIVKIVDPDNVYGDYISVSKNTSESEYKSVWNIALNTSDNAALERFIASHSTVTATIITNSVCTNETFTLRSSGSGSGPSPTPTPAPDPVEPIKDPETPTTGDPVKDEKTGGNYVVPDPTKNEVVYKAPPSDEIKKTVTIPDKILVDGKEMKVVKIDPGAFKNNDNVKTINVGKNIETIGAGAFEGASNLTKVTLGKNVETIGSGAFKDCTSLKSVSVPSKTTEIGDGAFEGCKSLTSVKLGSAVKEIGDGAFKDCTKLKSVSIPSKTKEIGDGAFAGCKSLTSISIGKSVTEIGDGAFAGDKKLKKVTIGKSVEEIGDGAFKDCKSLTSLSLPSKAAKIGSGAFEGCSKLTTLKISSKKLTSDSIDAGAFSGLTKKTTIKVPKSKLKEYKALFKEKGIDPKVKIKGY